VQISYINNDEKQVSINRLLAHIDKNYKNNDKNLLEEFVKYYYCAISAEDMNERGIHDLYGSLVSHWQLLINKDSSERIVKVYNPSFEVHGWQSSRTVVEIAIPSLPFVLSSLKILITRLEHYMYLVINAGNLSIVRNKSNAIVNFNAKAKKEQTESFETVVYMEIERQSDEKSLEIISLQIKSLLEDIDLISADWKQMTDTLDSVIKEAKVYGTFDPDYKEKIAFLNWLKENNFTFLGYSKYNVIKAEDGIELKQENATKMGIIRSNNHCHEYSISDLPLDIQNIYLSSSLLILGKTNFLSIVHRPVYTDYITLKIFDKTGNVIGEHRFVGLYTSSAYNNSTLQIPWIKTKVNRICEMSMQSGQIRQKNTLVNLLDTMPRDDMFHASEKELQQVAVGIYQMQERPNLRFFIRKDVFGAFFSCLVYVPRERFNSELREQIQNVLVESLGGHSVTFFTHFSESILARIHFIIRVSKISDIKINPSLIEQKLIDTARTWQDDLKEVLFSHYGEEDGNELYRRYSKAFPASYKENFSSLIAMIDIGHIERMIKNKMVLDMSLYKPIEGSDEFFRFKLFHDSKPIILSDVVPMLENLGVRILNERPYKVRKQRANGVWINDYKLSQNGYQINNPLDLKDKFQDAFRAVWEGRAENDGFNKLVLIAGISWEEASMIRAYYKYLWQAGLTFSQTYVEEALCKNIKIVKKLIELFTARFDPDSYVDEKHQNNIVAEIKELLDEVTSLNEDTIIQRYVEVMLATVRCSYFQKDNDGNRKPYLSFKFNSQIISFLPKPKPLFEIFVYSPRSEGVHLRGAKVARGGLRWSDRHEDFRTEVLGLMKAQQVKNSVIVPLGAKGGFVVKNLDQYKTREEQMKEVISCYQSFIRGLLDLTDNRIRDSISKPEQLVTYDADDSYLVVAADKGTATFSDIANEIAIEYGFWLGDAFASGGSAGYDHKKMGITARGAWESVKKHFLTIGIDTQEEPFTVIGVGDMAGDVFGNGMLLSEHIKLIATFNHMHIFVDPDPDPSTSFAERKRLFELPRSSWSDYDPKILSKGAKIFDRNAKFLTLNKEIKELFHIKENTIIPDEFIKVILKSKIDLFWNGGIGTFVKSSAETHADVGDRNNDNIRINATEFRVKVVGEGGNLGLTQLARIEYALQGGILNTDAIDNSAGVNCSDTEVNIKILVDDIVRSGEMTSKQRNRLLVDMTTEVSEIVLDSNRRQNEAISMTVFRGAQDIEMHYRLINQLEREKRLDRELEFLPTEETVLQRRSDSFGLTRPEMSVVLAYSKILLKEELLNSGLPEEQCMLVMLEKAFPRCLTERYAKYMRRHQLKREIICTQLSNIVVDDVGINFIHRLQDETGSSSVEIVKSYLVSKEVFNINVLRDEIYNLPSSIDNKIKYSMLLELNRLIRRASRWFLKNRRSGLDIENTIELFRVHVETVSGEIFNIIKRLSITQAQTAYDKYINAGIDPKLALNISSMPFMFSALDVVEAATSSDLEIVDVANVYYILGKQLKLDWFREMIKQQGINSHWDSLARAAFRDDVDKQQRNLTVLIMQSNMENKDLEFDKVVSSWISSNKELFDRWEHFVQELNTSKPDFTMFAVALRELLDLSQTISYSSRNT